MVCPWRTYGPRGSAASVDNIATALSGAKNTKAVLLENHGVLAFGARPRGCSAGQPHRGGGGADGDIRRGAGRRETHTV